MNKRAKPWANGFLLLLLILLETELPMAGETINRCLTSGNHLVVMSANIAHGRGESLNQWFLNRDRIEQNLREIAQTLEVLSPDLVAFQEIDAASRWSGQFDHLQFIKQQSSLEHEFHGIHSSGFSHQFGTAFLSRVPLQQTRSIHFSSSFPSLRKGFVAAQLPWPTIDECPPLKVNVISVHFDFLRSSVRKRQSSILVNYLKSLRGPIIVMGDFNSDWAAEESIVKDVAIALDLHTFEPGSGELVTYPSGKTRFDWILVSKDLQFLRYITVPDFLSDHDAVLAELKYSGLKNEC